MPKTFEVRIEGVVQGVGFRPFVYRLAQKYGLNGFVRNNGEGVLMHISGEDEVLRVFMESLSDQVPERARLDYIQQQEIKGSYQDFQIIESLEGKRQFAAIPPDLSLCLDCQNELKDPKNRRYQYPFINCVNCGPRYTILKKLPYDRPHTSMDVFEMCETCKQEYGNPADRRYHAQPISCPECGPRLSVYRNDGTLLVEGDDSLQHVARLIKQGYIVAIKGMGGFQLVCDARWQKVVRKLREKKRRPKKPFAVMLPIMQDVDKCGAVDEQERDVLMSSERPIVLVKKRYPHRLDKFMVACDEVAPDVGKMGFFLPYTPIHVLLMERLKIPIIATSANISEEPIITSREELQQKLSSVYDYVLDYDREIVHPCDDSVAEVVGDQVRFLRKARGYAPDWIELDFEMETPTLAVGAHLKNTVAFGYGKRALISPHIGDLGTLETEQRFLETVNIFQEVFGMEPKRVVCDLHSGYVSTRYAEQSGLEVIQVQHHRAHIFSLMAEQKINQPILGIAWDGTGLGDDGTIWGGEFFIGDWSGLERKTHIKPFRLLGGDKAVKEPWRLAVALLFDRYGQAWPEMVPERLCSLDSVMLETLFQMHQSGTSSPFCSSIGRWFDAVAVLLGLVWERAYEGEAGLMLEALVDPGESGWYDYEKTAEGIDLSLMLDSLMQEGDPSKAASRFINTLAQVILDIAQEEKLSVGLSGGVFQNRTLSERVLALLHHAKIPVYFHERVPCNDGGIALGQLACLKHFE